MNEEQVPQETKEEQVPQETKEEHIPQIINTIDENTLDNIFGKYFDTLEQQQKQQLEEKKQLEKEQQELEQQELEQQELEQQELEQQQKQQLEFEQQILLNHKELIEEIKILQQYQQYNNNLTYFGFVSFGVILVSVLMYKFLKIFI